MEGIHPLVETTEERAGKTNVRLGGRLRKVKTSSEGVYPVFPPGYWVIMLLDDTSFRNVGRSFRTFNVLSE
jgi:hypothetical protein